MFKRLFGRGDKDQQPDLWSGTTRAEWTVPRTYFGTAGWRLEAASIARMSWVGAFGGTMTFTQDDAPAWTGDELGLDDIRQKHRAAARAQKGGLVSAEFVEMSNGAPALEVVTKYKSGLGYRFEGCVFIDQSPLAYTIALAASEKETGVREALVNALRMELGEIDVLSMIMGPVDATGGRKIPGMQLDPYDSSYDDEATYSASDDPRIDEVLQTHPLSVIRSTLRRARATWECETQSTSRGRRRALPPSSGPKVILSDRFFQALHAMLKKA